ncbi:type II secretion system protein M [Paraneptunicella aestuarii]|uniref:type II secretion system protein GspM n=1 Tax=Paraneptunicella aestuarii TaxID=2831148 RepID=UPI001E4841DB|nr:type II secretion system protein GspM [Paraneptunicella aestuarii]UAA39085.1 type II secretion system protein M [Paraneptunicella aestuarii]
MKFELHWYKELQEKFLDLTTREQILLISSGLLLFLFGGYVWLIEPVQLNIDNLTRRVETQRSDLGRLENQIKNVEFELSQDPDEPLRRSLEQLKERIGKVNLSLREQTVDLIPANKMPKVLEKILAQSTKLKLISMSSIPPVRMMDINSDSGDSVNLFQHGVMLVLEGEYMDILNYLDEIENLEWRFYWKRFNYLVLEHPVARVEIELYTLSTSKAFIGV